MIQTAPPDVLPEHARPLTLKQRRDVQEIWRKIHGVQTQLVRLMAELDIRIQ